MRILRISMISIWLGSACGCGLKGPLYLPEPAQQVQPVPAEQTPTEQNSVEQNSVPQNSAEQASEQDSEQDEQKKKKPEQPAPSTTL